MKFFIPFYLWIVLSCYLLLSECFSSHRNSWRFLVHGGKATNQQSCDVSQLFLTNQQKIDQYSVISLNWRKVFTRLKMNRNYSYDNRRVAQTQTPPKSIRMTDLLLFINIVIFLFSCRNPILLRKFAKNDYRLARGEVYRLMTALFLHADVPHLVSNSFSLSQFGPEVEKLFGRKLYLLIYLGSGILANLGTYAFGSSPVALGASGAISGLLGAFSYYYWANRKRLGQQSQYALEGIKRTLLYNLIIGLGGSKNIDHFAHAYGFAAGGGITAVLFVLRDLKRRQQMAMLEMSSRRSSSLMNKVTASSPWQRLVMLFRSIRFNKKNPRNSYYNDDDYVYDDYYYRRDNVFVPF